MRKKELKKDPHSQTAHFNRMNDDEQKTRS